MRPWPLSLSVLGWAAVDCVFSGFWDCKRWSHGESSPPGAPLARNRRTDGVRTLDWDWDRDWDLNRQSLDWDWDRYRGRNGDWDWYWDWPWDRDWDQDRDRDQDRDQDTGLRCSS